MRRYAAIVVSGILTLAGAVTPAHAQTAPGIELVGTGSIPGSTPDKSGLSGVYTDSADNSTSPQNALGAFGSGIAYTGFGNVYLAINDRGYGNGDVKYRDRFHLFRIAIDPAKKTVTPTLLATRFFTNAQGRGFVGSSAAFDPAAPDDPAKSLRLDPEGVRIAPDGTFFISDEYGPYIDRFSQQGRLIGQIPVPAKFRIAHPGADGKAELPPANTSGRQENRGMEGLAISPDGQTLIGIMQSPLIQDGALDASGKRIGFNIRILKIDIGTGKSAEYLYRLDNKKYGVNEILAINDHQLLVDERDSKAGNEAAFKEIFLIDLAGATDISDIAALPTSGVPAGVTPVHKMSFLNLLDAKFELAGPSFPEKIEGMTFGPDLPNGDHLLLITSDNDLIPKNPGWFFAFRIPRAALPDYRPQTLKTPFAAP